MKKTKKRAFILFFALAMIVSFSIVGFAKGSKSQNFDWKGYIINALLQSEQKHSGLAKTKITNISAPNVYKVRALINAKSTKDGTGSILKQNYEDAYNAAIASVYHSDAKSFVSHHNIQSNGSVAKSYILNLP